MMALSEAGFERFVRPVLDSPFAPPEMRRLGAEEVGDIMGGLVDSREVHSAAYNPCGIQVETGRASIVLAEQVRKLGGIIRAGTTVVGLQNGDDGVRIRTGQEELQADLVILACGAWTNELLAMIGWRMPLLRMVATRILTDDRGLPSRLPTVQCRELRLWLRESFGAVTWGTVQGYAPLYRLTHPDARLAPGQPHFPQLLERLVEHQRTSLERVFPPLRGSKIASWVQGMPCYTPDHNLMIGRVPGNPRFLVAGGDNETGVTHGPGLGRMLAEMSLQRQPFVDPYHFRLDRFARDAYPTEALVESALSTIPPYQALTDAI
jgi:glycine/D-amino acid oxidase-like deaminating enzyme